MAAIIDMLSTLAGTAKILFAKIGVIPPAADRFALQKLVDSADDGAQLLPIRYVYDPVPSMPTYLRPGAIDNVSYASRPNTAIHQNSIRLNPIAAGLPYRSHLIFVRASRYSLANLDETVGLLKLLTSDRDSLDVKVGRGITVAGLAEKELRQGVEERIMLATVYMFPSADQEKARQIACMMVMYFVFDDKVEETPDSALDIVREDFLGHIRADRSTIPHQGPLRSHIDAIMQGIKNKDLYSGNGGDEMLLALRNAFKKVHPPERFQSLQEYLDFRRLNVGARFVIAAAKFSIGSSVDTTLPQFAVILRLIGDHLGIVNDIASYDKELRAFETGNAADMINIVALMKNMMSLPDTTTAKAVAYAYQLQVETWILEEIECLRKNALSDEEWWFIEVLILAITGNVFWCMISSRYGGKAARISP